SASSKVLRPPLARRVTSRGASLIADQIHCGRQPNEAGDSQPAAVCKALPQDRVALLLRGAASAHSAKAERANLCATSLPNFVRDDPGLAGLGEGGCHGHDNCGGCEHAEVDFAFEHGVTLHALHHGRTVTNCNVTIRSIKRTYCELRTNHV